MFCTYIGTRVVKDNQYNRLVKATNSFSSRTTKYSVAAFQFVDFTAYELYSEKKIRLFRNI